MGKMEYLKEMAENTAVMPEMKVFFIFIGIFAIILLFGIFMLVLKNSEHAAKIEYTLETHASSKAIADEAIEEAIQERIRQLAIEHAELYKLRQWVSELEEEGELDVDELGAETANRVKILAIKQTEDELGIAYGDKKLIEREKSRIQRDMSENCHDELVVEAGKKQIKLLNEQRKHVLKRIEDAEKRLKTLTNS